MEKVLFSFENKVKILLTENHGSVKKHKVNPYVFVPFVIIVSQAFEFNLTNFTTK